jgi:penicillin-binding protein 2
MLLQPPQPRREPEPDGTKLALRAATLGIVALVLFGVLVFRLWALQVLRSADYVAQANVQNVREIPIPAQRGDIVDRNGVTLVENTSTILLRVDPSTISGSIDCASMGTDATTCSTQMAELPIGGVPRCVKLPEQPRCVELARIGRVLGMSDRGVWRTYETPLLNGDKGARYVINAGPPVSLGSAKDDQVAYVLERRDRYPGVSFLRTYKRSYTPWPAMGMILGHVSALQPGYKKDPKFKDLPLDSTAGQDGVEYTYDGELRGVPGKLEQSFDASGRAIGQPYMVQPPQMGDELQLTIDAKLQQTAVKAIYDGIQIAHNDGELSADKGAIIAMDPKTGGILAMASVPSYSPTIYGAGPAAAAARKAAAKAHAFNDLATNGVFAPGSTFKPFTAAAAWWQGFIGPGSTRDCAGSFERSGDTSHTVFENWDTSSSGTIDLAKALEISCDTFFYQLGNQFYDHYLHGQEMFPPLLRRFGFGSSVPLDVGAGTTPGLVPDPQWRERK